MPTDSFYLAANEDDGHDDSTGVDFTDDATVIIKNDSNQNLCRNAGFRFNNVTIPQGMTIVDATLLIQLDDPDYDIDCNIYANDVDSADDFVTDPQVFARTRTSASVNWLASGSGALIGTPNIAAVIQEVISRGGWASGNELMILCIAKVQVGADAIAISHNQDPGTAAILEIEWEAKISWEADEHFLGEQLTVTVGASLAQQTSDEQFDGAQITVIGGSVFTSTPADEEWLGDQIPVGNLTVSNSTGDEESLGAQITITAGSQITTLPGDDFALGDDIWIDNGELPTAPSGLTAAAISRHAILLQWTDNAVTETAYEIYRSTNQFNWTLIDTVAAGTQLNVAVGLSAGTTYYFRVRAVDSVGPWYSAYSNVANATTEAGMEAVFRGDAIAVSHVRQSATGGGPWVIGETITIEINGKTVVYTLASATVATFLSGLAAALNASTITEFAEITWSATATQIRGTSDTAGKSIDFEASTNSSAGTMGATSTVTANDGPNALTAANMDVGSLPGAGDTLTFENTEVDVRYNLDALSGTLAHCYIEASMEGEIGLPRRNIDGDMYWEYRPRYLEVDVTDLVIGEGEGEGSPRLQIDLGSVQASVKVVKTGASAEDGYHALRIKGTHASNVLEANGTCTVDVAPEADDAAVFATIIAANDSLVRISRRVTLTNLILLGNAEVELDTATALPNITSITIGGAAKLTLYGDNAITTITITEEGTLDDRGEGTITTLNCGPSANYTTENNSGGEGARIITNTNLTPGSGRFNNGNRAAQFTNPINLGLAGLKDYPNLDLGYDIDIQVSG